MTVALANDAGPMAVPANEPVVLQFNRFLNPWSVTRQNIRLEGAGGGAVSPTVIVDYDPVLLQVTLSPPSSGSNWLIPGQDYVVNIPAATPTSGGVQAVDDATLAKSVQLQFSAVAPSAAGATPPPVMHFCADVLPIFLERQCINSGCHGPPEPGMSVIMTPLIPAQGLVLADSDWLLRTAIGRVSHESNVGPTPVPSAPGPNFGVDMPIIDPGTSGFGDPGNSWLLYKVLLGAPSAPGALAKFGLSTDFACGYDGVTTNPTFGANATPQITQAERGLLSNFILGREMPYPLNPSVPEIDGGGNASGALSLQEMERLRLWIRQGAQIDDAVSLPDGGSTCQPNAPGGCNQVPADAGADAPSDSGGEGSAPDAGTKG